MRGSGLVEIQSHSYNSHYYAKLAKGQKPALAGRRYIKGVLETYPQYLSRMRTDFNKSKLFIMKRTGEEPIAIAFPYGWASPEAKRVAKEEGFKIQIGIKQGVNSGKEDFNNLKRITVKNSYSPKKLDDLIKYYTGRRILLP